MPGAPRFRRVVFDLDGTLTDSSASFAACMRHALDGLDVDWPDDQTLRSWIGPPLHDTFRDHLGLDDASAVEALRRYRERYAVAGVVEDPPFPGVVDLLTALSAAGVELAIATSKPTPSAVRVLERAGLLGWFAFVGGAEFDGPRQAKADVLAHTLDELAWAANGDVVMVGDREHDVRGAHAHGLDCVGVLWGFGSRDELEAAGAVGVVATPAELAALLLRPEPPSRPSPQS